MPAKSSARCSASAPRSRADLTAKADELNANINQRGNDLKRVLDEKSGVFLCTFGAQGQKFSTEIERITHNARAVDRPEGHDLRQVDRSRTARRSPA